MGSSSKSCQQRDPSQVYYFELLKASDDKAMHCEQGPCTSKPCELGQHKYEGKGVSDCSTVTKSCCWLYDGWLQIDSM